MPLYKPVQPPIVDVAALTYTFSGGHRPALQNVNLRVSAGEVLVITGPSGCGKSTLALAIGGYLFQQYDGSATGSVTIAGKDARNTPVYEIAETVGLVQQDPEAQFCTLTVQDEVAFGLENQCLPPDEIRRRITQALNIVKAPHLIDRELRALSGGEKQKVAIAAVMAMQPRVLILDEPTSNLDPQATADIFEVIDALRIATGIAVVVIEHKLDYLRPYAPRIVSMKGGSICSETLAGTPPLPPRFVVTTSVVPACRTNKLVTTNPGRHTPQPVVEIDHLHVEIQDHVILEDVSMTAGPGEFIIVMGDNGSGKSTLLRSLLGLQKPTQGHIKILGADTRETPVSRLAQDVGFVFQNPNHQLFADTVWEEATIAPRNLGKMTPQTDLEVRRLLEIAGLAGRLEDHPYRLSYGEKRRLNLISVLSYHPRLLLLDEILIGQDRDNVDFLLSLLRTATTEGAAIMMVNHNPEVTQRCADEIVDPRLLFLEAGHLVIDAPAHRGLAALAKRGLTAYLPTAYHNNHAKQRTDITAESNAAADCVPTR